MDVFRRALWLACAGGVLVWSLACSQVLAQDVVPSQTGQNYTVFELGFGRAGSVVEPNREDLYYEDDGMSLGLGFGVERQLAEVFALTGRVDLINLVSLSNLFVDDASWGGMLTAGFILGKVRQSGQFYLSVSAGPGYAILDDGELCILACPEKSSHHSGGVSGRAAIGVTGSNGRRFELAFLRSGGNGADADYPNGEDAYLQSMQFRVVF